MEPTTPTTTAVAKRTAIDAVAKQIDEISEGAMGLFSGTGSFAEEIQLARAVSDMRDLLTPEVMAPIMALQNTDLGFRTDRDPRQIDTKTGNYHKPYSEEVVREVFIESRLRGFHTIGNEFNIITGRFYGAKAGFRRKVTHWPGLSEFRDSYDVPRMSGDRGALVKCRASWRIGGKEDSIEREFAVRVNSGMGSDAITGKAERKLLKAVHDRLAGWSTPDGDVEDEPSIEVTSRAAPVIVPKPATTATTTAVHIVPAAAPAEPQTPTPSPAAEPKAEAAASPATGGASLPAEQPPAEDPRVQLQAIVETAGHTWKTFVAWGIGSGQWEKKDAPVDWNDLDPEDASRFVKARKGLLSQLERFADEKGGKQ